MAITKEVTEEISGLDKKPEQFRQQIEKFKEFKKKLDDAGLSYGDRYDIPLMSRIGHHRD